MLSTEELFSDITGLALNKGASEAELLIQVRDYERNHEILSGAVPSIDENGEPEGKSYPFDYFWEQSQESEAMSIPNIPGHSRGKGGSKTGGKSPRSPLSSLAKSPSSSSLGKSPKSPSNLASLSDEALKALKESIVQEASEVTTRKSSTVVKFQDEFPTL